MAFVAGVTARHIGYLNLGFIRSVISGKESEINMHLGICLGSVRVIA